MIKVLLKNVQASFNVLSENRKQLTKEQARVQVSRMVNQLREATPVDTGFARSSWSVHEGVEAFFVENSAPYIQYLNAGTSKQAPANFIEMIALQYGKPIGPIVEIKEP
jgi:hypothetical protein